MKRINKIILNIYKVILGSIFILYYRPKMINKKVIPIKGPIIICGNHKHLLDQCLTILSTIRPITYMAKKEYFDSKFSWFFKGAGCICVDRENKGGNSLNEAIETLKNKGAIGIFPEGTRNKTTKILLPFKFGTVSLAKKSNATIVPFGITGEYKFFKNNLKIKYGTPFKVGNMTLEEANQKLYEEVKKIITK